MCQYTCTVSRVCGVTSHRFHLVGESWHPLKVPQLYEWEKISFEEPIMENIRDVPMVLDGINTSIDKEILPKVLNVNENQNYGECDKEKTGNVENRLNGENSNNQKCKHCKEMTGERDDQFNTVNLNEYKICEDRDKEKTRLNAGSDGGNIRSSMNTRMCTETYVREEDSKTKKERLSEQMERTYASSHLGQQPQDDVKIEMDENELV